MWCEDGTRVLREGDFLPLLCISHAATFTHIQLDMMLHAEHGMFRMQPQEKTQEDFKFWSTQPMLKLGTRNGREACAWEVPRPTHGLTLLPL